MEYFTIRTFFIYGDDGSGRTRPRQFTFWEGRQERRFITLNSAFAFLQKSYGWLHTISIDVDVHRRGGAQQQQRGEQEKSRKLVVICTLLSSLSTVQLEWNVAEKEVREGGMTEQWGVSSVLCSNDRCDLLQPSPGGSVGLINWHNDRTHTKQREKEGDCFLFLFFCFFTLVLPICRHIHNPAGRREEKQEGREKTEGNVLSIRQHHCWRGEASISTQKCFYLHTCYTSG